MEIPLTHGKVAVVDDDYGPALALHRWHAQDRGDGRFYAVRKPGPRGGQKRVWMAREVLALSGMEVADEVDHINGDTLDNRRANLRPATREQNGRSRRKQATYKGSATSSRWKGVTRRGHRWAATCDRVYLGRFATEEDAAKAYNAAARSMFGDFAEVNPCD